MINETLTIPQYSVFVVMSLTTLVIVFTQKKQKLEKCTIVGFIGFVLVFSLGIR